MLVHICCSVDSHYFLSELQKVYPDEKLIGFFYNPNIHPKGEYDLRLNDVKRSCQMLEIELLEGEYSIDEWFDAVRGMEDEPEKGERCLKCFDIRLIRSAIESQRRQEKTFTTTLLSSPMKEQEKLFSQGDKIAQDFNLEFIKVNFRSNGGVQKQNALAKKDNLYRQNYCGCYFALSKQRKKQNKISLEMLSDLSEKKPLGSIEDRIQTFKKRDLFEEQKRPYILTQKRFQVYRVIKSLLQDENKNLINHYTLANSHSKKISKIEEIIWVKPDLKIQNVLRQKYIEGNFNIGFSQKDSTQFVLLDFINLIFDKDFKTITDLKKMPLSFDEELELRKILSGNGSQNPIVILEYQITQNVFIEIEGIFQEENIFKVVPIL